ncbi:MAG: TRAP transporter permease [Spirochaetes bacterium]|nr:TRAP transporter permease [Spirochaetota bacterium]
MSQTSDTSNSADDVLSEKEQQEIKAKFDKESRTRQFTGIPNYLITGLLLVFAVYVFATTLFFPLPEQIRRTVFIGLLMIPGFLIYPMRKGQQRVNYVPWYDFVLAALGAGAFFYFAANFHALVQRSIMINQTDMIVGAVGIIVLFELCRRIVGIPILVVAGGFIAYAFYAGFSLRRVIHHLFYTTDGIIGTPIAVVATFVVLFVFLAAFLEKSGIAHFFIDMANSVTGAYSGGPAKVAVVASAFLATISGSSVANTVSSGAVTIPVMKKAGYKPHFAGAVEASASSGGQIMPPILGAAAFLMAEITGIPYTQIALAALFPAALYFVGVFLNVHFEAKRLGLAGLPKESLPKFWPLFIGKGYLFLPIVILIVMMAQGFTPSRAAIFGILGCFVLSFIRKDTRFTPGRFVDALTAGSRNTMSIAMACAVAGCIVGIVSLTGIGQQLVGAMAVLVRHPFLLATGTSLFVALFLTMIACIVVGLGMPTTAKYVIMATVTAPMVLRAGAELGIDVPILAVHMFVFYYGVLSDVTPPVALASYAAASIAKSDPMKTSLVGTKLAATAFIIPYVFVFSPAILLIGYSPFLIAHVLITAFIGMFGFGAGLAGYMLRPMNLPTRALAIGGFLLCLSASLLVSLVGIGMIGIVFATQLITVRKEKAMAPVLTGNTWGKG